ncbi:TRAP transporter large permease [Mycolicibacterium smegmatis]|uniref:Trap dicarboxylate transporter, dctm subunit n=4 Tax=Mycolicibacterium smegmatis TaxID=1772 RepID=A0R7B1_MYCS2|nr:TRAP transporter large permease [Mycolicibacterium smegmatis]AAL17940.1 putative C4 decarboxylate transport protein [Mycolicibacterium smegmatis MC2 155]ABK70184.1 trap dicarboxylate transporter, dctm subunit [Mycolicibacterium smegmatis MC2 155]AFP43088.1 TRAP dicarboxylate transporter, DctM subunit [Mycolicibacterium smegmatis MC2 155]AIU11806.1 membrane protein [Mycolicibacterium smegmatis MC2 155]AIU18431.1 membrane protein [Mycolicibacterium smegmatis]
MSIDPIAVGILIGGFAVLILLRIPIALALALAAVFEAFYLDLPLPIVGQRMVAGLDIFALLAIPFFILGGEIMAAGGISRRLIAFASLFVGWLRGGLAMINIGSSTFFGALSGSSVADVSAIGSATIPMMKQKGYDADYAVCVTITGAAQAVMIPPSHNLVIFSMAAGGVSIGALFVAGIVPGLLIGLSLLVLAYLLAVRRGYPKETLVPVSEVPRIVWEGLLSLLMPVIILGGILSGIFTATESAAIGCVYAFFLTFFVYRDIPLSGFIPILQRTARTLGIVLFIIAAAGAFGYFLTFLQVPEAVTQALLGLSDNKIVILLVINLLLLALGAVMDMAPLILIMTPILLPVATSIGMDPVQFGIMLLLNLAIGLITPPVGNVLFVGAAIGQISIEKVSRALPVFLVPMLLVLLLITFLPQLSLALPGLLGL